MKKLRNPFQQYDSYQCFGCDPENHHGLQMEFYEDGMDLLSIWEPKAFLQGYGNVLHGGIQSTLLDELASWIVYVKARTGGVTAHMDVKFRKPVYVNQGKLTVRGRLKEVNKRFAMISAEIYDSKGEITTVADIRYFVYPEEVAREKFFYPGHEAFYEDPGPSSK